MSYSNCYSEPVSYAAVEEDGTSGLVIEVFDDLDKVGADVVLLYGCPQSFIPNPVEGLLEVYEDMVEVLLVLEIFLTENAISNTAVAAAAATTITTTTSTTTATTTATSALSSVSSKNCGACREF